MVADHVNKLDASRRPFRIECDSGDVYLAETVILATGAQARWLDLPSEQKFRGYGVSACATCDGFFYRNKEVLVIGGGNTAVEEALFLTNFASKVTLVHRRDSLRSEKILQDRLFKHAKIEVLWDTALDDIRGAENPLKVTHVALEKHKDRRRHRTRRRRRFHRYRPRAGDRTGRGTGRDEAVGLCQNRPVLYGHSVPGLFAAGDVADEVYRQAVTAAGLGCMAALEAERFLAAHAEHRAAAE